MLGRKAVLEDMSRLTEELGELVYHKINLAVRKNPDEQLDMHDAGGQLACPSFEPRELAILKFADQAFGNWLQDVKSIEGQVRGKPLFWRSLGNIDIQAVHHSGGVFLGEVDKPKPSPRSYIADHNVGVTCGNTRMQKVAKGLFYHILSQSAELG